MELTEGLEGARGASLRAAFVRVQTECRHKDEGIGTATIVSAAGIATDTLPRLHVSVTRALIHHCAADRGQAPLECVEDELRP